jgi:hypothetical protein
MKTLEGDLLISSGFKRSQWIKIAVYSSSFTSNRRFGGKLNITHWPSSSWNWGKSTLGWCISLCSSWNAWISSWTTVSNESHSVFWVNWDLRLYKALRRTIDRWMWNSCVKYIVIWTAKPDELYAEQILHTFGWYLEQTSRFIILVGRLLLWMSAGDISSIGDFVDRMWRASIQERC